MKKDRLDTIYLCLPREITAELEKIAKLAGVQVTTVMKVIIARDVVQATRTKQP